MGADLEEKTKAAAERHLADKAFGRHVRSCRRARGLTQEVLAERAGLSADTIRRLEHGSFSPSLATLRKLAEGLGVRVSTLFEAFEVGEREPRREVWDLVNLIAEEELDLFLRMSFLAWELIRARTARGVRDGEEA